MADHSGGISVFFGSPSLSGTTISIRILLERSFLRVSKVGLCPGQGTAKITISSAAATALALSYPMIDPLFAGKTAANSAATSFACYDFRDPIATGTTASAKRFANTRP